MTDNSPVAKIKESLIKIMAEIKSMDVRMGVLSHTILQYKTKEKNQDKKSLLKNIDAEDLYDFEWSHPLAQLIGHPSNPMSPPILWLFLSQLNAI